MPDKKFTRRTLLASGSAFLAAPAIAQELSTITDPATGEIVEYDPLRPPPEWEPPVQRNTALFRARSWQDHFSDLDNGAILVDVESRALHFWGEDGFTYRLFPSSVPLTEDLTRKGRTRVTRKVEGPSWAPTPNMIKRYPEWPRFIPPGPDNPLGTHALYLGWKYYRIHGTHDNRKIGRQSSNGCIGLYNEHIAELYELTNVGTQVLLI